MLQLIEWILCRLSPAATRRVGVFLGLLSWHLVRLRRAVTLDNLAAGLQLRGAASARLGERVYAHVGSIATEFFRTRRLTPERARALLGGENIAEMRRILGAGRGALLLSAHLGNWDLLACCAGLCGLPIHVVTRRLRQGALDRFWMSRRAACGVRLLPADGSALQIQQALRRNEMVAFVLDQHQPGGVAVPFFGRPAVTSTALAQLARLTRAPVVPVFLVRDAPRETASGGRSVRLGDGEYRLEMEPPVELIETGDRQHDIVANTARFTATIEAGIRRHPEQWFWLHRRWKGEQSRHAGRPLPSGRG